MCNTNGPSHGNLVFNKNTQIPVLNVHVTVTSGSMKVESILLTSIKRLSVLKINFWPSF